MALDYQKTARDIVEAAGGPENIITVAHCMTRLRFSVRNIDRADLEAIQGIKGVLGCVYAAEQLQVILGQNLMDTYDAVVKQYHFTEGDVVDENLDVDLEPKTLGERMNPKNWGKKLLAYISGAVTPMLPVLIAGGMLKVVLMIATLIVPEWANEPTYTLLSIAADGGFYFMPIWVAWGAAQKLGGTPIFAMATAAAMFAPNFIALVNADPQVPQNIFGLPVMLNSYASGLLPALLLAYAAYQFERLWNKVVPGIFKSVFVGPLTIFCTYTLTMVVLAPLGTWIGDGVVAVLMGIYNAVGPVALAILAGTLPFMIMVGVHTVFGPFMLQLLENPGYDALFRPALLLHNMAEGGACLGVALRTKNKEFRSEALSIAVGCIVAGVTEPALYGITFRLKKPLIGVCAGGALGGLVGGIMGMRAYIMGYSNIIALPIFQDTVIAAVAAIVTAIVVAGVVAFVLGFDEDAA